MDFGNTYLLSIAYMTKVKKKLVIIPGLFYQFDKHSFDEMIKFFSREYEVYFFGANYNCTNLELQNDLVNFIENNQVEQADFVTHSYGAIALRLLLAKEKTVVDKVVEIAPFNNGSRLLKRAYKIVPWFFRRRMLVVVEFIEQEKKILALPYPKNVGVIAGTKTFKASSPEYYLIKIIYPHWSGSDGKIFVDETKFDGMLDFLTVKENHTDITRNKFVVESIDNFFIKLKFE